MAEDKAWDLSKEVDNSCKLVAVCMHCRHHAHNPTIEFNFGDSKVYWLCPSCTKMNEMDFSKRLPPAYPKTRRQ
mgnify:CR=1 FL=1|jgi:hypothetical protein